MPSTPVAYGPARTISSSRCWCRGPRHSCIDRAETGKTRSRLAAARPQRSSAGLGAPRPLHRVHLEHARDGRRDRDLEAAIYALGGRRLVAATVPAVALLCLAVPPPRHLDAELVSRLQALVSRCSSGFLDAFRIFHMMEGNVVELPGNRLLVDQACSGIYSLFTLLLGTFFFALWVRASVPRTVFLLGAAVVWVLLGNMTRIVSIVLLHVRWNIDASKGWKHEALGLFVFALMLAMLASTDHIYRFAASSLSWMKWAMFAPKRPRRQGKEEFTENLNNTVLSTTRRRRHSSRQASSPASEAPKSVAESAAAVEAADVPDAEPPATELSPARRTWLGSWPAGLAFGVLIAPQMMMPGIDWKEVLVTNDYYARAFEPLTADTLPKQLGPFNRVDFRTTHREMDDSWGEHSRAWYYVGGQTVLAVSVDYQFVDWHDLTLCYTGQGWKMEGSKVGLGDAADRETRGLMEADFFNLEGRRGYVVFGLFDRFGHVITPPKARGLLQSLAGRLRAWSIGSSKTREAAEGLNYQFQVFVDSEQPLSAAARQEILAFYQEARKKVQSDAFPTTAERSQP
ncbi:MAG: exosortase U [Isosphaeraceae bacterium]